MIDFKQIINSTDLYNFHSHTQFCDGRDKMENFVISAINKGFKHLGFTPHSPIPFHSPCNIAEDKVAEYFSEFNRLKQKYGDKIALYRSFEIDYINEHQVHTIFYEELSSGRVAQTISQDTGASMKVLSTAHNVSKEDFDNGITFLDIMQKNYDVLEEALN